MINFAAMAAIDPSALDLSPRPRPEALEFLLTRRSTPSKLLEAPGPDDAALALLLKAASRVPDHGKLVPWRFVVVDEAARAPLAEMAATASVAAGRPDDETEKTRKALLEGPCVVVVIATPRVDHPKVPAEEQLLSAGLAAAGLVYAALAAGYGAQWLTGWASHARAFTAPAFALQAAESVVGFVHIGTPRSAPPERDRPDLSAKTARLTVDDVARRRAGR